MAAQDRVRGNHAVATQRSGQSPHERGEHGPVRPVQAWTWVGATEHSDLVTQHKKLDVLGGGRATRQQDQPEHLPEDQVQQAQRHARTMSDRRSPLASDPGLDFWHPTGSRVKKLTQDRPDFNILGTYVTDYSTQSGYNLTQQA